MGLFDFLNKTREKEVKIYADSSLEYEVTKIGSLEIPDKLTDSNAFSLANTVSEIYFPIDFLADRGSKIRFYIADSKGEEVVNTELNRFITNINPFYTFSDLFYQSLFSLLADGNIFHYINVPSLYNRLNANNISRIDVLLPDSVYLKEYTNISILNSTNKRDFINDVKYTLLKTETLDKQKLSIYSIDLTRKENSMILSKSPLFKSYRNINNLLAVYSARYNVYANNGAAGYLSKKSSSSGLESLAGRREDMIDDLNSKYGVVKDRRLWGISSIPIEFVNTLIDIQRLLPFEETLENSIKIAGAYQIPAGLVPRKDQSTYSNQEADEKKVWENTLMSAIDTVCSYFTNSFMLNKIGYSIKADYSTVSALTQNELDLQDLINKKLSNMKLAKELNPDLDISNEIEQLYGKGN